MTSIGVSTYKKQTSEFHSLPDKSQPQMNHKTILRHRNHRRPRIHLNSTRRLRESGWPSMITLASSPTASKEIDGGRDGSPFSLPFYFALIWDLCMVLCLSETYYLSVCLKKKKRRKEKKTKKEYICPNRGKRYTALDALRLVSPDDEYFQCESCNGELVAEGDKFAAQEMGDGDDNARRRHREKLKDMLQKIESLSSLLLNYS
ncbi:hypothetical protein F0562_023562 [Nyssa sinensis]|uniref:Transcription initiation factor IIE subunit alpha N-terminal domain-containing protein n=1 Tax=Nyssa sinensis TaxID=561372 RepID=A0A5J5BKS2_9ASTE|nr:hypothetical protein F0562_023562 [Nyssa sinensis]